MFLLSMHNFDSDICTAVGRQAGRCSRIRIRHQVMRQVFPMLEMSCHFIVKPLADACSNGMAPNSAVDNAQMSNHTRCFYEDSTDVQQ